MSLEDCFLYDNRGKFSPVRILLARYNPAGEFDSFVLPSDGISDEYRYKIMLVDKQGNEHRTLLMPGEQVSSEARRIVKDLRGKFYDLNIEIPESLLDEGHDSLKKTE